MRRSIVLPGSALCAPLRCPLPSDWLTVSCSALVGDVYAADGMGASAATVASFFLSSLIIAVSALFFDSRALIKFICFVAIPLIGVAFVMLPLFSDGLEAAQSICIVGFNSFYFMVWRCDKRRARRPAASALIAGLLVLVGAESLGSVLGSGIRSERRGFRRVTGHRVPGGRVPAAHGRHALVRPRAGGGQTRATKTRRRGACGDARLPSPAKAGKARRTRLRTHA